MQSGTTLALGQIDQLKTEIMQKKAAAASVTLAAVISTCKNIDGLDELQLLFDALNKPLPDDPHANNVFMSCAVQLGAEQTQLALNLLQLFFKKNIPTAIAQAQLQQQNNLGWTFGMLIARNESGRLTAAEMEQYLNILEILPPIAFAAHLQQQTNKGSNLGMIIAHNPGKQLTALEMKQYLKLLAKMPLPALRVHLFENNTNLWNLGTVMADNAGGQITAAEMQQYLDLVSLLSLADREALLQKQTNRGQTFGMLLAKNQNGQFTAAVMQQFLKLLAPLSPSARLHQLNLINDDGMTLGMTLARNEHGQFTNAEIELFFTLFADIPMGETLNHCNYKNADGMTLGMEITKNYTSTEPQPYFNWLITLLRNGASVKQIHDHLNLKDKTGKLIGTLDDLKKLAFDQMIAIENPEEKIQALKNALGEGSKDKEDPMYKLFVYRTSLFARSEHWAEKMRAELLLRQKPVKIEPVAASTSTAAGIAPWSSQLQNPQAITSFLQRDTAEVIGLMSQTDNQGLTLRNFLYQRAHDLPHLIYFMFAKDLIPESDFVLLRGMQNKLLTSVLENATEHFKRGFLVASLDTEQPTAMALFMRSDKQMTARLQQALSQLDANSKQSRADTVVAPTLYVAPATSTLSPTTKIPSSQIEVQPSTEPHPSEINYENSRFFPSVPSDVLPQAASTTAKKETTASKIALIDNSGAATKKR